MWENIDYNFHTELPCNMNNLAAKLVQLEFLTATCRSGATINHVPCEFQCKPAGCRVEAILPVFARAKRTAISFVIWSDSWSDWIVQLAPATKDSANSH